ncbi:glycosyltransferase family 2 protein [Raoultibacter phocaeensis]|uniref:glycosyltransferase family 2 protein n=1 Tax=Raoultibacter phocaeensis TaxID=2479841 RepID=UPI00111A18FC|nr:glycosyltransferase [Raoultibacter phocaeensis]
MSSNQNERPAVSILVPTYNVERYLSQCLDSLCAQTLENIEIICINDGATDGSPAILRDFAARDPRVAIIDKENSGYGASLNIGIEQARGEYLAIAEPDDFAERTMYETLYALAKQHDCDLVKSNFYEYAEGRNRKNRNLQGYPVKKPFDPADEPRIICTIPSIWTGLYRTSMLVNEGIAFRETPGAAFQDTSFVLKTWFAARRCVLSRKALLHYRMDNPSSSVKTSNRIFVVCDELAESERFLHERPKRCERFIPWFHVDKWGKYRWNYERIDQACHEEFAERMAAEYRSARDAGELAKEHFSERDWSAVTELLERGAAAFAQAHPETF